MKPEERLKWYKEELEKVKILYYKYQGAIEASELYIEDAKDKKK